MKIDSDQSFAIIAIPVEIKSQNVMERLHWSDRHRLRQEYELLIRNQMTLNDVEKAKKGQKFKLAITTYRNRLMRDEANISGGAKQMIDALVNEGFIWDDSIDCMEIVQMVQKLKSQSPLNDVFTIIARGES